MKRSSTFALCATVFALGCGGSDDKRVAAPVPRFQPVAAAKPEEPAPAAPVPQTRSQIAISKAIQAACGISDSDANFDFDSAAIRQEDHGVLAQLATCFQSGPLKGHVMRLVGRADPRGDEEYNMVLGGERAESVKDYLARQGLAASSMETTSRGEMDAQGTDEATWARDRRVDVLLAGHTAGNSRAASVD